MRDHFDKGVLPDSKSSNFALFADYCHMLAPSAFVSEQEILNRLQWER